MFFVVLYIITLLTMDNNDYYNVRDLLGGILFAASLELCIELGIYATWLNGG